MIKVKDLFEVVYGVNLELVHCIQTDKKNGIPFVSRTSKNNGVVAYIEEDYDLIPNPAHTISVAGSGSVLSSFYQEKPYYSGRDLYYLKPKVELSVMQMLYYCMILQANKYRYNYGRQANKTLKNIGIPDVSAIPKAFLEIKTPFYDANMKEQEINLEIHTWRIFSLDQFFTLQKGERLTQPDRIQGDENLPLITASSENNGVADYISLEEFEENKKMFENKITIDMFFNVFYQPNRYFSDDNVHTLIPKNEYKENLNTYTSLFLVGILRKLHYRYAYGRQFRLSRFPYEKIKLPATPEGTPDWDFMEKYIKTLRYSKVI
ncbi:MAG: hypothetical protein EAZ85_02205 [Bacteroidetes bacterium]|nr:MAG: hypothetical protein EAZ85_02205 [Bacteroidota bacterium]TAG90636.1 MAG: hypothetical protein EAZ20_03865 [Bacteroidota bacterium]